MESITLVKLILLLNWGP